MRHHRATSLTPRTVTNAALTAAALILFAPTAFAASCGEPPPGVTVPDGATVTGDDMAKASEAMEKYSTDMGQWRQCTTTALNSLAEQYSTTLKEWQAQLAVYQERGKKKKK